MYIPIMPCNMPSQPKPSPDSNALRCFLGWMEAVKRIAEEAIASGRRVDFDSHQPLRKIAGHDGRWYHEPIGPTVYTIRIEIK